MRRTVAALLALAILTGSSLLQAESLRDIYELALENDAQLKAQQAEYLAKKESENLGRAALLPQINSNYSYRNLDTDRKANTLDFSNPSNPVIKSSSNTDIDVDGYTVSLQQALFNLSA